MQELKEELYRKPWKIYTVEHIEDRFLSPRWFQIASQLSSFHGPLIDQLREEKKEALDAET